MYHSSKETDITKLLVVVLIALVGVLIVTLSGSFIEMKTSSSTRAANPQANSEDCRGEGHEPLHLTGDNYNTINDVCMPEGTEACNSASNYSDPKVKCLVWGFMPGTCCRSENEVKKLGDIRCDRLHHGFDAKCVELGSCAVIDTLRDSGGEVERCAMAKESNASNNLTKVGNLKEGMCCADPNASPSYIPSTPTLAPTIIASYGMSVHSCGLDGVNCAKLFAYNEDTGTRPTIKKGEVSPDPRNIQRDGMLFNTIACVSSNGSLEPSTMKCAFIPTESQVCDGFQFAFDSSTANCYQSTPQTSHALIQKNGKWVDTQACLIRVNSGYTWSSCRTK